MKQRLNKMEQFLLEVILAAIRQTSTDHANDHLSDYDDNSVKRLLRVLGNKELSMPELMEKLGLAHMPNFRKNYLNPALDRRLIERTVLDRPRSRNQRYRKCR